MILVYCRLMVSLLNYDMATLSANSSHCVIFNVNHGLSSWIHNWPLGSMHQSHEMGTVSLLLRWIFFLSKPFPGVCSLLSFLNGYFALVICSPWDFTSATASLCE